MRDVELRELSKRFGNVIAIDEINLKIRGGSFTTLLGPSGCGKTTTLRCIAGLEKPDKGEIIVGDTVFFSSYQKINIPPNKRNIGMVFQSYAVWPHMTVYDNVAFPLRVRKLKSHEIRDKVRRILEIVKLEELENRLASELSGGQQQRVALARALVYEPGILLLDEPLSNLDATLRDQMRVELKEIQRKIGITTLFVTHDQVEALSLSDVVALMKDGKVVALDNPRDLYERPRHPFAASFLGKVNFLNSRIIEFDEEQKHYILDTPLGPVKCNYVRRFKEGDRIIIAIKAEKINLFTNPVSGENVFKGKLVDILYMGMLMELIVDVNSQLLRIVTSTKREYTNLTRGSEVYVNFPLDDILLLDSI
jgi:iron(III) transport system ATP-binding protein